MLRGVVGISVKIGQWPWHRPLFGTIQERLHQFQLNLVHHFIMTF